MQTIKGTSENLIALFVHVLIFQPTLAKASDLIFKVFPQQTAYLKKKPNTLLEIRTFTKAISSLHYKPKELLTILHLRMYWVIWTDEGAFH